MHPTRFMRFVLATLLCASAQLTSQNAPPRNHLVYHVYVDPTFGDDLDAMQMNPSWQVGAQPFTFHPDPTVISGPDQAAGFKTNRHIGGLLAHAPYPFRTIGTAIEYLCTRGPTVPNPAPNPQPAQGGWMLGAAPPGLPDRRITWIIIHCLPGLYGPTDANLSLLDADSGLPWNGESFPIRVPYGISLQGTSALDTIIDPRNDPAGRRNNAIEIMEPEISATPTNFLQTNPFGVVDQFGNPVHDTAGFITTFVDGLTIRNAEVSDVPDPPSNPQLPRAGAGAGIAMRRFLLNGWEWDEDNDPTRVTLAPTISNCFIYSCGVGVAVLGLQEFTESRTWRPKIVNNTFAENTYVDIWNGSWDRQLPALIPSVGINRLRVVNCLCMDAIGVLGPIPFTGMHESDLHVTNPVAPFSFNAYAAAPAMVVPNRPIPNDWTTEWPASAVQLRPTIPPIPLPPVVNLAQLLSDQFLINRVFFATRGPNLILAPHDYRLAPWSLASPVAGQGMPNPLVNQGITLPAATNTITFGNGLVINTTTQPAGLPELASDAFTHAEHPAPLPVEPFQLFNAWDTDCDGFGNPRVVQRAGFPNAGFGGIDIGADEVDELVMSGYVHNTRMFSRVLADPPLPAVRPLITRPSMFFFNLPGGGPYPRPSANAVFGGLHWSGGLTDWFVNTQTNPAQFSPLSNYGFGGMQIRNLVISIPIGSWRSGMVLTNQKIDALVPAIQFLVPRNFQCDFSPLLPPDIHPLWAVFGEAVNTGTGCPGLIPVFPPLIAPLPTDLYASNPWHADDQNYRHQRQPANLSNPLLPSPCDSTIFVDNPFAYYDPSNGNGQTPPGGFPRSAAQTPTRLSNVTSGTLNPPGTYLGMNLPGTAMVGPQLDVIAFPPFQFGPFAPCTNTSLTTYIVGADGVGDTATGCPDQVPPIFDGLGIRINCMLGVNPTTGFGTSNLQTFLTYSRSFGPQPPTGLSAGGGPAAERIRPAAREDMLRSLRRTLGRTER